MKIVIDDTVPFVAERASAHADVVVKKGSSIGPEDLRDADALVASTRLRAGRPLLEGSAVRLVATGSIGMDHIDLEWCAAAGIEAVNAPGCNAPAVVQYVVCSLAAAGFDFRRDTLGVVGKGNIGGLLVHVVRSAGGKVLVCDPPRAEKCDGGVPDPENYLPLETLLRRCDAVTFHVPLTRTGLHPTFGMLSGREMGCLKEGAILINASRGGVVDENALHIRGDNLKLIIDTWFGEPLADVGLIDRALISTTHIAGYSEQGKQRAARSVIEAINRKFSLSIPTDGLADYSFRDNPPALEEFLASYDPRIDSAELKSSPESFETLRLAYAYRPEP